MPQSISIHGCVFPCKNDNLIVLTMIGLEGEFISVFKTVEELSKFYSEADIAWTSVKVIENELEFISSVISRVRIAFSPKWENNTVVFKEVILSHNISA